MISACTSETAWIVYHIWYICDSNGGDTSILARNADFGRGGLFIFYCICDIYYQIAGDAPYLEYPGHFPRVLLHEIGKELQLFPFI